MIEQTVSLNRVCASIAWTLASLLFIAAWAVFPNAKDTMALLLGQTAMLFVGIAAVLTIRGWVTRVCQVVRANSRAALPDDVARLR